MTGEQDDDWGEHHDAVQLGIWTTANNKLYTILSDARREARLPKEAEILLPVQIPSQLSDITSLSEKNISEAQEKQKEQHRKWKIIAKPAFKVGNIVLQMNLLKKKKVGHKMGDTWLGP